MSERLGSELRIDLLGAFRVAANGKAVDEAAWRLRKARSVVKLLALTPGHTLHRKHVIEALWPDRDRTAASNNLRQVVFVARRALDSRGADGAARIALVHDVLALAGERLRIDIEEFEAAAAQAERAPSVERYRQAIDLYVGELLPEDRFDEWTAARRQALSERHLTLLVDLARLHEQADDPAAALAALQQALVDEPLHESAHRELIRMYALTGRRQRALAQFHLLRESLDRSSRMSLMSRPAAYTGTSSQGGWAPAMHPSNRRLPAARTHHLDGPATFHFS